MLLSLFLFVNRSKKEARATLETLWSKKRMKETKAAAAWNCRVL
jgi:hypothetical protein